MGVEFTSSKLAEANRYVVCSDALDAVGGVWIAVWAIPTLYAREIELGEHWRVTLDSRVSSKK